MQYFVIMWRGTLHTTADPLYLTAQTKRKVSFDRSFAVCCGQSSAYDDNTEVEYESETPSDTIFAFLTLNTMSPAHNKIFGAKFLSFERAAIVCWHTADYAAVKRIVQWITEQTSIIGLQLT